jgi:serine/threonine-protein phosphatase 2A regulatory subunit A
MSVTAVAATTSSPTTVQVTIDAFEFFKTQMQSDQLSDRVEAIQRMHMVAAVIGSARVLSQLVPYLAEVFRQPPLTSSQSAPAVLSSSQQLSTVMDDDEVYYAFARNISRLIPYCGKDSHHLVPFMEFLASQDETVIRDAAVVSLCRLADYDKAVAQSYLFPCLKRMTSSEWFTPRVAACGLFPTVYKQASDSQRAELRKMYVDLFNEEAPMVKRAAARKFHVGWTR